MTNAETAAEGRVALAVGDAVAILTLDRAAKLNALGPEMLAELERHIAMIDRDIEIGAQHHPLAGHRQVVENAQACQIRACLNPGASTASPWRR